MADFEKPSLLFRFEINFLKPFISGPVIYRPYVEKLGLEGSERVLDYGCGAGVCLVYLADALKEGGRATGLDSSPYMLSKARKRTGGLGNVDVVLGDARTAGLEAASFDLVSMVHVLHDIDSGDRAEVLESLAGFLKPAGRICLLEPVSSRHGISPEEIRALLEKAGFSATTVEPKGRRVLVQAHNNPGAGRG